MKMKTIEQKAKAYDEALKVLHKYDGANIMFTQDLKEEIFPELQKSEDERIRKALINGFNKLDKSAVWYNGITNGQILAWLEKQNEQKPVFEMKTPEESLGIDSDTYNKIVDECIYGEQKLANKIEPKDYSSIDPHFFKTTDNVEPKFKVGDNIEPIDSCLGSPRTIYKICDGWYETNQGTLNFEFENNWKLVEQKPAWSEEDELIIKRIYSLLYSINESEFEDIHAWLKFLKDRVQPKQEWSEEDITKLKSAITLLQNPLIACDEVNDGIRIKIVNWLKSIEGKVLLQSKQEWKPSDEQMRVLDLAIKCGINRGTTEETILVSLFDDLKKLKD